MKQEHDHLGGRHTDEEWQKSWIGSLIGGNEKILALIMVITLAVCFFNRQPELCNIEINDKSYEILIKYQMNLF